MNVFVPDRKLCRSQWCPNSDRKFRCSVVGRKQSEIGGRWNKWGLLRSKSKSEAELSSQLFFAELNFFSLAYFKIFQFLNTRHSSSVMRVVAELVNRVAQLNWRKRVVPCLAVVASVVVGGCFLWGRNCFHYSVPLGGPRKMDCFSLDVDEKSWWRLCLRFWFAS